jgi:small conductance mechanosensitive channel
MSEVRLAARDIDHSTARTGFAARAPGTLRGMAPPRRAPMKSMLQTRSHSWREVGLARELSARVVRRARLETLIFVPLLVGIVIANHHRHQLFGVDLPARIATAVLLLILGWQLARDIGRALGPTLFRRMDPGAAGTAGFVIRFVTMVAAIFVALHTAGLDPRTLALGGVFTAVIFGLAAQQTFGNLFAGTVLLSARPFRVGDRVRLQGGPLAGQVEGVVSSLGLLYTTFANGEDAILVPNSVILSVAVTPLREPDRVDLRARLPLDVSPADVHATLERAITVPLRGAPEIELEALDGDEVVVRIRVAPESHHDGPLLAGEVLAAVTPYARGDVQGAVGLPARRSTDL